MKRGWLLDVLKIVFMMMMNESLLDINLLNHFFIAIYLTWRLDLVSNSISFVFADAFLLMKMIVWWVMTLSITVSEFGFVSFWIRFLVFSHVP